MLLRPVVLLFLLEAVRATLDALPEEDATVVPPLPRKKEVRYEFRYAVDDSAESGVVSDRWETRVGSFVKGAYSLLGPDGKVRTVDYQVDGEHGFTAVVSTHYPPNVPLSGQQLYESFRKHKQPLVNVLTDRFLPEDKRPVPGNFHALRPRYYLAFAKDHVPDPRNSGAGEGAVEGGGGLPPPGAPSLPSSLLLPPPLPQPQRLLAG